jgi:hypothetical protein
MPPRRSYGAGTEVQQKGVGEQFRTYMEKVHFADWNHFELEARPFLRGLNIANGYSTGILAAGFLGGKAKLAPR